MTHVSFVRSIKCTDSIDCWYVSGKIWPIPWPGVYGVFQCHGRLACSFLPFSDGRGRPCNHVVSSQKVWKTSLKAFRRQVFRLVPWPMTHWPDSLTVVPSSSSDFESPALHFSLTSQLTPNYICRNDTYALIYAMDYGNFGMVLAKTAPVLNWSRVPLAQAFEVSFKCLYQPPPPPSAHYTIC